MTRRRSLRGARAAFVLFTLVLAWWGFRGRWSEIGGAVVDTGPVPAAGAVALAALGIATTAVLWRLVLRWVGSDEMGVRDAAAVFLVGQLGKYVPGSVWSVAAQAQLGRRHGVPARSSAAASALFLLLHTASGLLLGGLLLAVGVLGDPAAEAWWLWSAVAVGAACLAPPLVRRVGDRLVGSGTRWAFGPGELAVTVALMTVVWACYGASLSLLVTAPDPGPAPSLAGTVAAFALAHAVGVLVVVAPAGVGVREGVLVALLAPVLGVPGAAAAALLSRVAHAVADFAVAGAAAVWARRSRAVDDAEDAETVRAPGA